jgi:phage head maturation protease
MPTIEVLTRSRSLDVSSSNSIGDDGVIRMIASTNAPVKVPVMVDGTRELWDEILEHGEHQVDACSMRALLINHDPDQIAGPVRSIRFDGASSIVEAQILPDARLQSGVRVIDAVRSGALKGVSIGYSYNPHDSEKVEVNYEKRQIVVRSWRISEATLTPIPADTSAGVRSLKGTKMSEVPAAPAKDPAGSPAAPAPTITPDAAAIRAEIASIVSLADSLKLRSSDYVSLDLKAAQAKMLTDIAARDAAAGATPKAKVESHIEVGEEAQEKIAKRAIGAVLWNAGFRSTDPEAAQHEFSDGTKLADLQSKNDLRGKTMTSIIRGTCEALGCRTGSWDNHTLARIALGLPTDGARDASNVSTGYFQSFVFANIMKKAVSVGFQMGSKSIKYQPLVARNFVPDYKQFAIGGLGIGNLSVTVENQAFPELDKTEGVYLDRVRMWGGTISLSEQAIVSDDTGRFMEGLRQAGVIAQKTIDKRCFQVLLRGISTDDATSTWTDNTTGSATIVHATNDAAVAARANLSKVEAALMNKVGLDGNPMGNMASYLVVPPDLAYVATGLMGVAPGQQNQTNLRYSVITSPWLQFASLTGNSATSYYLISDPSEATGLVLSTINGMEDPRVEQYDPGAVAAYKWKIYLPFECGMGTHAYGGKTIIAGVQQGTV